MHQVNSEDSDHATESGGLRKIAFVSHSYMERETQAKLLWLARRYEMRLISPNSYPTPYGWYPLDAQGSPGLQIYGYPIQFLHFKRTPTRWFLRSHDLGFASFQPEIIHVEMEPHSWITCQALLYRRLFAPQAKVVLFTWENLTLQEQGMKARLLEQLSIVNRPKIDFFICGNRAGRDILLAKGVSADRVAVIPQVGIDPEVFYPYSREERDVIRNRLGISEVEFAIGFVGRIVEEKGILDLAEAVGKLVHTISHTPVLVCAGSGALEKALRTRCAALKIKLIVIPPCTHAQVAEVMNALDVIVLPSRIKAFWREQFGRVLIEAMACGVPVIGSDSGEIPNVIADAGLVFHEGNREQLCSCLRLCCDNEKARSDLGSRGLERVLSNYTNSIIAERTAEVYERLNDIQDRGERAGSDASTAQMPCV